MLFDYLQIFLENNPSVELFFGIHKRAEVLFPLLKLVGFGGVILVVKRRKGQKRQENGDKRLLVH